MQDYWHKQTTGTPLYPDLLWSRPENKGQAGKLLVVGGNAHGFAAAAEAYNEAVQGGAGTIRVVLPDALQKTVSKLFPEAEFVPSTPVGSFARQALAELLGLAAWSDNVLLAGDLGRNSETAVILERFVKEYKGPLTVTKDAVDYFAKQPAILLDRPETCAVVSFAQLQKIVMNSGAATALKFDMDFLHLVDALHGLTLKHPSAIITKRLENVFVAVGGQVSTTKLKDDLDIWRVKIAAHAAVWWLQNPTKTFEALTSSICQL